MRQASFVGLVTVLALFIGGCTGNSEDEQAATTTPPPSPAAAPASPSPSTPNKTLPSPSVVIPQRTTAVPPVPGLVKTLPPDARAKQANLGPNSRDPFSFLPVKPLQSVTDNAQGEQQNKPVPVVPNVPSPPINPNPSRQGNTPLVPRPPQPPSAINPKPPTSPGGQVPAPPSFAPKLPELPEPTLARGIEVTGVIEVDGVPQAIVKVPNEPPRYVKAGQRLSNGQVLVKRIEVNRGPTPVVILEQYGIEVAKRVGEKPTVSPEQGDAPTASRPVPPPLNGNTSPQA